MRSMKTAAAVILAAFALASSAIAQTNPGLTQGQKLTPAQWNNLFASKQDTLGYTAMNAAGGVFSGRVVTAAPGASQAGFNLTPGSTPGSPANGDLWVTSSGLFVRANGVTVGPLVSTASVALTIGSTPITSGTTTRVLYDNGGVLGEYTISGTGSVAMTTSPSFTTPNIGAAAGSTLTLTSSSANALDVGLNGATNPAFRVDASTASQAAGLRVLGAVTGGTVALDLVDSGSNTNLSINAKGTGTIQLGNVSTGNITLARPTGVTGALGVTGAITGTSNSANALAVGPNGATNPVLQIDGSTGSQATGLKITGAATGAGAAIAVIDSGSNSPLTIDAKGTGTITLGGTSTGNITLTRATQASNGLTVLSSFTATGLVGYSAMASAAIATNSNYFTGASNVLVPASVIYQAETTTTYGTTTTFDFDTFINSAVTLTGNITTNNVSNVRAGKAGSIAYIQGGSGGYTAVFNSVFKFVGGVAPTLSSAVGAIDILVYSCRSATNCPASLLKDVK